MWTCIRAFQILLHSAWKWEMAPGYLKYLACCQIWEDASGWKVLLWSPIPGLVCVFTPTSRKRCESEITFHVSVACILHQKLSLLRFHSLVASRNCTSRGLPLRGQDTIEKDEALMKKSLPPSRSIWKVWGCRYIERPPAPLCKILAPPKSFRRPQRSVCLPAQPAKLDLNKKSFPKQ